MKVRKKPVTVDASPVEFILRVGDHEPELLPKWVQDGVQSRTLRLYEDAIIVRTLEGTMRGKIGDFLIRGVRGELYPCAGDVFRATYDIVTDEEDSR